MAAALDVLAWRRDLDLDRVAAVGVSLGGYYAPRAAAGEPRIRAVAGVSGPFNFGECWDGLPPLTREAFRHHSGAGDEEAAREKALQLDLAPVIAELRQPALIVTGKLDRIIPWEQTRRIAAEAPHATLRPLRGGQPRLQQHPVQVPAARRGLDSKGARRCGISSRRAEMERRFGLARDLMRSNDLEALVLFGNSGVSRGNMANAFWLSNHLDLHHCYLVVPADEAQEAALYTGLTNHVPNAREVSDVPIVEWGGYDPAERSWRAPARPRARARTRRPRGREREVLDGDAVRTPPAPPRDAAGSRARGRDGAASSACGRSNRRRRSSGCGRAPR